MFIEPAKADEPWTRHAKSALKNKCPSSCPSRQERVRNKKAGQCSLPRPNEQPCSPSVLFFAPFMANEDASAESLGRGNKMNKTKERNVLRQGVWRMISSQYKNTLNGMFWGRASGGRPALNAKTLWTECSEAGRLERPHAHACVSVPKLTK